MAGSSRPGVLTGDHDVVKTSSLMLLLEYEFSTVQARWCSGNMVLVCSTSCGFEFCPGHLFMVATAMKPGNLALDAPHLQDLANTFLVALR